MLVSVIIPNYNHAVYLEQRIDSVLGQTVQDFEVIILDDCSKDNSREIIEKYRSHPKVSNIVYNKVNSGSTFRQWQKGLGLAKGEWIWIAESDDWCEAGFLQELLAGIQDNTSLAFAQSIVTAENKILWISKANYLAEHLSGKSFIAHQMLAGNAMFNASMCLFRRKYFDNITEDFTTFKFCGDWLFWIEIARQGDVYISGKVLNYFRKHNQDVSGGQFRNGNFYIEYLQLVKLLQAKDIITSVEKERLIGEKYAAFLRDKRVGKKAYGEAKSIYKRELGNRSKRLELGFLKEKLFQKW